MIQLSSLVWVLAIFFAIIGFMRGFQKEVIALAGIVLAFYTLFQFDSVLRGLLFWSLPREQVFFVQAAIFLAIVWVAYQTRGPLVRRDSERLQSGILGGLLGFANGYLIGGTLWYFLDINEYPLYPLIISPTPNSPSALSLNTIPVVLFSGGTSGGGDFLVIVIVVMFFLVLWII